MLRRRARLYIRFSSLFALGVAQNEISVLGRSRFFSSGFALITGFTFLYLYDGPEIMARGATADCLAKLAKFTLVTSLILKKLQGAEVVYSFS